MTNPTVAVIATMLRAGENDPRAYVHAVLDNVSSEDMGQALYKFHWPIYDVPWTEAPAWRRNECLSMARAMIAQAKKDMLV